MAEISLLLRGRPKPCGSTRLDILLLRCRVTQRSRALPHLVAQKLSLVCYRLGVALADTSVARTVSNFDAELRLVAAGLGGSVIPRQVAARSEKLHRICVIALTDAWAKRRLAIRAPETLSAAASRMVEFLASKVD